VSLGITAGSLTWMDWHDGAWWGCFAHYDHRPPEDKGNQYTELVKFDAQWRRLRGWTFPPEVLERSAPYTLSGGSWGPDGQLYASGHDRPEVYGLRLPVAGTTLELARTVPVPMEGQAIAFDRTGSGLLYGVIRDKKQVVTAPIGEVAGTR